MEFNVPKTHELFRQMIREFVEKEVKPDVYKRQTEYPKLTKKLPEEITFITAQELENKYPNLTPKNREHAAAKEYGAIFLMKIGGKLSSGEKHDGRAPDYLSLIHILY